MSDELPTIWPYEPHTQAKHQILIKYLQAWTPILSRQAGAVSRKTTDIIYIDGFAGPGIYESGEPGSPILAIQAVLNHSQKFPIPICLYFIEDRRDRYDRLLLEIDKYQNQIKSSPNISLPKPLHGDCSENLLKIINERNDKNKPFGPALIFLDQFGYSQVPISLINTIMAMPQCEILTYFNWDHLNRFISDSTKWRGITEAYGSDEWKQAIDKKGIERRNHILSFYKKALYEKARVKYVIEFAMCGPDNNLLYWLFFCTNNLRGLEEMKKAMWGVDSTGSFRFSDKDNPDQLSLLSNYTQDSLASELKKELLGKTMTLEQTKEYVLVNTPCYLYKEALKKLESRGQIQIRNVPETRRKGTFPDEKYPKMLISF
ncbi:MAG TPA: three-Cys-motif partner protein TcmP [Gammaproteobacteria bacterium]|nr:three-Cys-motif partner protein TcmP [Gammaproteobacteria bacterium]